MTYIAVMDAFESQIHLLIQCTTLSDPIPTPDPSEHKDIHKDSNRQKEAIQKTTERKPETWTPYESL